MKKYSLYQLQNLEGKTIEMLKVKDEFTPVLEFQLKLIQTMIKEKQYKAGGTRAK